MRLPQMTELATSRSMTEEFLGLNKALRIGAGEFADMENLTSSYYPLLSPRGRRGWYKDDGGYTAILAKDTLCWVRGTSFYVNGHEVTDLDLTLPTDTGPKRLVAMGAYVIIFPDKKWVNTVRANEQAAFTYGSIESYFSATETVTFNICNLEGIDYTHYASGSTAPSDLTNGTLWLDTSSSKFVLKQYSVESAQWVAIPFTYIKISTPLIDTYFETGDGVTISGVMDELADLNSTMVIQGKGNGYIIVTGIMNGTVEQAYDSAEEAVNISVKRTIPDMEYVIESNNRLWGCHYGLSADGESVLNEIYASKLGDFKNWNVYDGVSTDSYAASVGSDGPFTGAVNYLGYPLFFKETCIHKVYGTYPANFQIQTTTCRGVEYGSSGSLAIVNEVLFYKSPSDFCAYDGSLPNSISSALAEWKLKNAVSCSHEGKYYVSAKDQDNAHHFLVYDVKKGLWHREDSLAVTAFASNDGELYMISGGNILTEFGSGEREDLTPIKWRAETGVIGLSLPDQKNVSRITVRLNLAPGSRVSFFAEYDSITRWEHLCTLSQRYLRTFSVPLKPRRCDHLRLKIEGVGDCKIYSIAYTSDQGSEKP